MITDTELRLMAKAATISNNNGPIKIKHPVGTRKPQRVVSQCEDQVLFNTRITFWLGNFALVITCKSPLTKLELRLMDYFS